MDRALFVFRCLCLLVTCKFSSFILVKCLELFFARRLSKFQLFRYPQKVQKHELSLAYIYTKRKRKKIRNAMQQSLHGPSADGPKEKFPFLISLSRKASSFLQVNHRLIFVPASEKERENRRGLRNETREERRMIVKRSRHLVLNLTLFFFHLHLTQH